MDKSKRNAQKAAWNKENTVFIGVRLQKSTDPDIISYLEGKPKQTMIKKAIRYYIKHDGEKDNDK